MSGEELQRVMVMLGSAHLKSQLRLLGAGALLDKLRDAVADVHSNSAVRKGANTKLTLCIGYLSSNLGDELEGVLSQQTGAEAWHQVPAMVLRNRRLCRTMVLRLTRSLQDFRTLASWLQYGGGSIRHDNLSSSSSAVISTVTTQALGGPIVGRWALIEKMVKRILVAGSGDASSGGRPLVLPIVGGPGIGKTRLAQALFVDDRVRLMFKLRRWVDVSPKFHLALILMRIYRSRLSTDIVDVSRTTLKILIRDALLRVESYLLVLDDVWSDTAAGSARGSVDLEAIVQALPPNGAIILTTRNAALASRIATGVKPYYLLPLGEKLSTCLSRTWTDSYGGACPAELIRETGMMIAKKCRGVPFLLEYACRLLCLPQLTMDFWLGFVGKSDDGKHTDIGNLQRSLPSYIDMLPEEKFWQRFLQHCSSLPDADVVVKSASLSYQHLPLDLRGCLVYCSLFPLGYTFDAEQLAELLAMESFIPPTVTEAQRQGFLQVLLDDCFDPVQEHGGTSTTYRMHTMLHIFAQYLDREYISVNRAGGQVTHITSKARAQHSVRHVSMIVHPSVTSFHGNLFDYRHLRTLILLHQGEIRLPDQPQCEIKVIPPQFCQSLGHLQVLSLESTKISMIPPRFEQLSSLRYLNLSQSDIEIVPKSVSKLQLLQILILSRCEKLQKLHSNTTNLSGLQKLDLEGCRQLVELPQDLSKMRSLEYLNLLGCSLLAQMPRGVGQLYNLRTLLGYATPSSSDRRTISELQALPNLHRLSLECLDRVKEPIDARYAKLEGKRNLESLQLRWNTDAKTVGALAYAVLESLRPPQRLKVLEIVSYEGDMFPTWLTGPEPYLNSLVEISLVNLRACDKMLPSLGLLPCLKIAEISGAQDIICIDDSFYGCNGTFPSMERLTLSFMPNLEVWKEQKAVTNAAIFPRLAELVIIQCPKFRELHVELPSVEKLTLWMNNEKLYSSIGGLRGVAASLEHVSISFCEELLASSGCEALHDLAVLEKLDICGCHGLACLPQGFQHLSSLRYLTVDNCSNLETLPGWLENIPHLRLLHLSGCAVLQSIPQHMRQRHLEIIAEECPNLPGQSVKSVGAQTKGKRIIGEDDLPFQSIDENEY